VTLRTLLTIVTVVSTFYRMLKLLCIEKVKNNIYIRVIFRIKTAAQGVLGLAILTVAVVAAVMLKRKLSVAKQIAVMKGTA
jgi:hypothetical protein